ncbi:hypothetical protein [Roseimaritima sediminicola]|uniref:hypothetical protein n=1 Tax=Roseimaritima sediminicola TaxID=2662066 RepID=UPI0012982642|nr:hypothetical protein [Roseimaritima sediminicola]
MSFFRVLLLVSIFGIANLASYADTGQENFKFVAESVRNGFVMIRYQPKTAKIWFHNEENQWQRIATDDSLPESDYQYVILTYHRQVAMGGRNPLGGIVAPKTEPGWTVMRLDSNSGESWVLLDGKFELLRQSGEKDSTPQRGFRLISRPVGDHYVAYRFHTKSGMIWELKDWTWKQLPTIPPPQGEYHYEVIVRHTQSEVANGIDQAIAFELFRLNTISGRSWQWSPQKQRFVETPEQPSSDN